MKAVRQVVKVVSRCFFNQAGELLVQCNGCGKKKVET